MYLSDSDIRKRLESLQITTTAAGHPFKPDVQIQPASIDLRVDAVFWKSKLRHFGRRGALDLRRRAFREAAPRRGWKEFTLREGEAYRLRRGELLLARTYESFHMPADLAGSLSARSSYSRMGLLVHCGGDFVNPGWNGHMPLQLVNLSRRTLVIAPYLPVAQLMLVTLSSPPTRTYDGLRNKYTDDDGGPSYWWRDRLMEHVDEKFREANLPVPFRTSLEKLLVTNELDEDIVSRLEGFVDRSRIEDLTSWDSLLDRFVRSEDRKDSVSTWARRLPYGLGAATLAWLLTLVFKPISVEEITAAALTLFFVLGVAVDRLAPANPKLTRDALRELRKAHPHQF